MATAASAAPLTPSADPRVAVSPAPAWVESLRQYGVAALNAAAWLALLSTYLFLRRGYYNLYIANKALAGVAAVILGLVLLLGPLGKYFNAFDRYLKYRKELGMVGAAVAIAHALVSFFFLPGHFSRERFFSTGLLPFLFGLGATLILVLLVTISNRPMMHALGGSRWWFLQRWGVRAAFVLVALHVGVMKWSGWASWYQKGGGAPSAALKNPWLPGAGLLVGWFIGFVLLVRLADLVHPRLGKCAWYVTTVGFPLAIVTTFWWGQRLAA